jgi:hypothetical protein
METITNAVSAATNAASNLIYGDQTKADEAVETTKNNETAGKEPISGVEGKGTKSDPFDQGNDSGELRPLTCVASTLTPLYSCPASYRQRQDYFPRLQEQRDRRQRAHLRCTGPGYGEGAL